MKKINILNVNISETTISLACDQVERWIIEKFKTYICVAPVSTLVDCLHDENYRNIINKAGMVTPDGMPVVWLGRLKGSKIIERTYGPDIFIEMCLRGQKSKVKHYFYGANTGTLERLKSILKERFPSITIVGFYAPELKPIGTLEEEEKIDEINRCEPDILWIGLGSPKQDYWMFNHRGKLNVPVMIGVGAAFDFISGIKPQAPRWIQCSGFEWFYRLCCEPSRLWRRYLIGNLIFVSAVILSILSGKFFVNNEK